MDKDGNTPLHIAARYGHELLINTLITSGADCTRCVRPPARPPDTFSEFCGAATVSAQTEPLFLRLPPEGEESTTCSPSTWRP